jgi:uncharacterized protein (DUF488 family)
VPRISRSKEDAGAASRRESMKASEQVEGSDHPDRIWTVGHSTRSGDEFNEILLQHEIGVLIDVRSFPGSRRYPQFNKAELSIALEAVGIGYQHLPHLGGRRQPSPTSKNTAWKNSSFRAYADHMDSKEFQQGIVDLLKVAAEKRTAIMCAEALWWRCHRSLIADFLKAKGFEVIHILDARHIEQHPFTSAARIVDGQLSYEGLFEQ